MAPLNGRPPDRREKPSSATSVIDIGSHLRASSYLGKLTKKKNKTNRQTTVKPVILVINSYDDGLFRVTTEKKEAAGVFPDGKLYERKDSAAKKASRAQPQGRNSIEARASAVTRTKNTKANDDGPVSYLGEPVSEPTNPARKFRPSMSKSSGNCIQDQGEKRNPNPFKRTRAEKEQGDTKQSRGFSKETGTRGKSRIKWWSSIHQNIKRRRQIYKRGYQDRAS